MEDWEGFSKKVTLEAYQGATAVVLVKDYGSQSRVVG